MPSSSASRARSCTWNATPKEIEIIAHEISLSQITRGAHLYSRLISVARIFF